ncbi:MAG: hypothetical protein KIT60_30020 [Burkholderiaceae bacterium]|nr:hypothetical protein [Burkholderiaceae bacterium]
MHAAFDATGRALGDVTFNDRDQQRFAMHSRDRNPMHVDATVARRTLTGRQVVHGIHVLIQALDRVRMPKAPRSLGVSCSFANPVGIGDPVRFIQTDDTDADGIRIVATVRGLVCTQVEIARAPTAPASTPVAVPHGTAADEVIGELADPLDCDPAALQGATFVLPPRHDGLAEEFPRAAALVGAPALSALAGLSYFVGMVCPGLHSMFSSLQLRIEPESRGALRFEVKRWDPRFRLFTIAFSGAVSGELRAFRRPQPQVQPSAATAAAAVRPQEFGRMRALVIGGSRGLGEVCCKLVCGGGGWACITYAKGRDDAVAVAHDVNQLGRGRCEVAELDLGGPFRGMSTVDAASVNCVFYFATPHIHSKRLELFSRAAFDGFSGFYLDRFHELCMWLEGAKRDAPALVYLPSTVFIDERPKGMTEYAMVKAAAEILAADLNRSLSKVRVIHSRLPRLATDQTASILGLQSASNLDTMLDVVRRMATAIEAR